MPKPGLPSGPIATLLTILVAVFVGACAPAETASVVSRPAPAPPPPIEQGASSDSDQRISADYLRAAGDALREGRHAEAFEAAEVVVTQYSRAPGSSRALIILAEAAYALQQYAQAGQAASRHAALFPSGSDEWTESSFLEARALAAEGRHADAFDLLLERASSFSPEVRERAIALMREHSRDIPVDALSALIDRHHPHAGVALAPLMSEYAVTLHHRGVAAEARAVAEEVLALGADAEDAALMRAILMGDPDGLLGVRALFAAFLPISGSPAMREFGEYIQEGIELALELDSRRSRIPATLQVVDDAGSRSMVARLEDAGVLAFIGPLVESRVEEVVSVRRSQTPILSPTARTLPADSRSVYSLSSVDPNSPRLLAEHAREQGLQRVAILYPQSDEGREEAALFVGAFAGDGRRSTVEISYPQGTTSFAEVMGAVAQAGADGLFLPLAPEDIELLAPQIAFFGLDTLGMQIMGTGAWAMDDVLQRLSPRHTDGVVVATSRTPSGTREEYVAFTREYETFFRKSLRSRVPALGYDAAGLLLHALRESGARTPDELRHALDQVREYPGVTGTLSVIDGQIVRDHVLVRLEDRRMVPLRQTTP